MILLSVGNSEGERRCDAKCYNAEHESCSCVCGGMNHGAGLKKAKENTAELAKEWIEKAREKSGEDFYALINTEIVQGELF